MLDFCEASLVASRLTQRHATSSGTHDYRRFQAHKESAMLHFSCVDEGLAPIVTAFSQLGSHNNMPLSAKASHIAS
jgi:hypothetical protein